MSDVPSTFGGLTAEARAVVHELARERGRFQVFPCSFAQQRLWFFERLEPGNAVYNVPAAIRISGALDAAALEATLAELVRRHEVLRTTFAATEGEPVQVVWERLPLALAVEDPGDASEAALRELVRDEARRPFALERGPLLRPRLLRLGPLDHVLLLTLHHVVSDQWSRGILEKEIAVLYAAFREGRPSPLPPLAIQYADFAVWQRRRLSGATLERLLGFWKAQLDGAPEVLELPGDRPRPASLSYRGETLLFGVGEELTARLRALCRERDVTLFMLMLAAHATLLHRLSGQDEVVIGAPVAGRERKETEHLVGCFVNTLTLRVPLGGNPIFLDLLAEVKARALAAYSHAELPFERLVEAVRPERTRSHAPVFQATLTFLNTGQDPGAAFSGLSLRGIEADTGATGFDLMLFINERGATLGATFKYSLDLFERATAERLRDQLLCLLHAVVEDPARRVSRLPLLPEPERAAVLAAGRGPEQDVDDQPLIAERVARLAAADPAAVAVVFEDRQITYGELERRANRLANHLVGLGAGPEVLVGVALEDEPEVIVALLAIWKAGAAYLPLDPHYPSERLSFLLDDAGVSLLVTRAALLDQLPVTRGYPVLLDAQAQAIAAEADTAPAPALHPEHPAYVIYTSGSTGRPKGVIVTHRGLRNLGCAQVAAFHMRREGRTLKFASLNFDASVCEIAGTLWAGGALCLAPRDELMPGAPLVQTLRRHAATHVILPPSVLAHLPARDLPGLGTVISAGEACTASIVEAWRPGRVFINAYGPTEGTVCATSGDVTADGAPSIGRPIQNVRTYVLDRELAPVPRGVAGEIFLGGEQLARGYLNAPDLTAERFIPDPFDDRAGRRLYRTGDRGRLCADGALDFIGRTDQQVKVRGYRVEPGEIEAALAGHASVRECAVAAEGDEDRVLVAYVVLDEGAAFEPEAWRAFLLERLPAHMLPTAFVAVEAMPLTPNGKVDRKALARARRSPAARHGAEPPATPAEEILAAVWCQVLGVEQVSRHDNYFTVGGDSIRAVQVAARAQERGLPVAVHNLFETPTIAALAAAVEARLGQPPLPPSGPFDLVSPEDRERMPPDVEDAYPLAALQAGMMFHGDYSADTSVYHDVFSFHIRAPFDLETLRAAYQALLDSHPALRARVDLTSFSQPLQLVARHVPARIELHDLTHLGPDQQEAALREWFELEKRREIDVAVESWRLMVHRRSERTFQLSTSLHHAMSDGWSGATLFTELLERYTALVQRREVTLTPPASTFREFVALERAAVASEEARAYWRERLEGGRRPRLLAWAPATPAEQAEVRPHPSALPVELSDGIQALARRLAVPLKTLLLAVHMKVLGLWSGTDDVTSGLSTNGRTETADGERVIGLYLNTVPLRVRLEDESWTELILRTLAAERAMLPHRRFPLAEIQRVAGRAPLFEASFNFIHFHVLGAVRRMEGIEVLEERSFAATNFPLLTLFVMHPSEGRLRQSILHDPARFPQEQIAAMAAYYRAALEHLVAGPERSHREFARAHPEVLAADAAFRRYRRTAWREVVLPTDRPRGAGARALFAEQTQVLPAATAEELSALARGAGVSAETVLLAAWVALLRRYAGGDQVGLAAERDHGTALLSCPCAPALPFRALVDDVDAECALGALHGAGDADAVGGAPAAVGFGRGSAPGRELALACDDAPGGLRLRLRYDSELFDAGSASGLLARYGALLEQALKRPELPLSELWLAAAPRAAAPGGRRRPLLARRGAAE